MIGPKIRRLYYSTKDLTQMLKIKANVLKTWELKFPVFRVSKSKSGRRLYKPHDLEIIKRIKKFRDQGFTDEKIAMLMGIHLKHQNFQKTDEDNGETIDDQQIINDVRTGLAEILKILDWSSNH